LAVPAQPGETNGLTDKPLRIEFPAQSDKETHRIIPCGQKGMMLFYKSVETAGESSVRWIFSFYDRNLELSWVKSAPVISSLDFKDSELVCDTLYLYFEANRKSGNEGITFQILRISLSPGTFILNNGQSPENAAMTAFRILDQEAFIGFNDAVKKEARIMVLELPTGKVRLFPVGEDGKSALVSFSVDTAEHILRSLVEQQLSKRETGLILIRQQTDGSLLSEIPVSNFNSGRNLRQAREISVSKDNLLIAGTYSQGTTSKKGTPEQTTGFFASPVVTRFQPSIQFYNFLDLKNSRHLLDARDVMSLRKKTMKKSRNDQEYSLDMSVLLHGIIRRNGEYILAAETYYPQFHTESFTDYDFYGRPFTSSFSVFDGYRFTGILVVALDAEGRLLWDNSMEIRNILTFSLDPKVTLFFQSDQLILTYLSEGKIASRIVCGNEVRENTSYAELELSSSTDKLLNETFSEMAWWYDDYFLCSGYQEIRDISKGNNDKRLVFFCNKVRFIP